MKENMTFSWKIRSKLSSFYIYKISKHFVKFEMIINILFNFQNPFQTLKTIKAGQYPLRLTKKNKTFEIKNKFELSLILKNLDQKITFEDGIDVQESLFSELNERLRNIEASPSGILYLLTDGPKGKLIKVLPK